MNCTKIIIHARCVAMQEYFVTVAIIILSRKDFCQFTYILIRCSDPFRSFFLWKSLVKDSPAKLPTDYCHYLLFIRILSFTSNIALCVGLL